MRHVTRKCASFHHQLLDYQMVSKWYPRSKWLLRYASHTGVQLKYVPWSSLVSSQVLFAAHIATCL